MNPEQFATQWQWTQHPCWLWVASCPHDLKRATQAVLNHVLSQGSHNPEGANPTKLNQSIQKGFYPNWTRITPPEDTAFISIDSVRDLFKNIMYKAPLPGWRVMVVEGPLNTNATNALLKTLEEPPPYTLWILWASHWGQVLPTLRSRCQRVRVPSFSLEHERHPLAWGNTEISQKIYAWGKLEALASLLSAPATDATALKPLWDNTEAWFIIDMYQRLAYQKTVDHPSAESVERWHAVSSWFQQAKASHLDPAHTLLEGTRLWQGQ